MPLLTMLFLILYTILCIVVHKTPYGRKLQWMGSNSRGTWHAGIDNRKLT
jgi:ribose/xylose/arabinose/galactoside ABC-type transport system permease subunit